MWLPRECSGADNDTVAVFGTCSSLFLREPSLRSGGLGRCVTLIPGLVQRGSVLWCWLHLCGDVRAGGAVEHEAFLL